MAPSAQSLAEIACQFDEPFTLDTSKYESAFGPAGTPLPADIAATVTRDRNWYRTGTGTGTGT